MISSYLRRGLACGRFIGPWRIWKAYIGVILPSRVQGSASPTHLHVCGIQTLTTIYVLQWDLQVELGDLCLCAAGAASGCRKESIYLSIYLSI